MKENEEGLLKRGKKGKVAIVAAMRKLLVILNARMRNHLMEKEVF